MRLAFYAPLKPPDHPVPSGDRRVAQQILAALAESGHDVEIAARLRSFDGSGDLPRQTKLAGLAARLASRYVHRIYGRPYAQRPKAWITYHLYYKAPDWVGPRVAATLDIPYVVIEASVADKRAGGPWSLGHQATIAALARAAAVVSLNPADEPGIAPHVRAPTRLHRMKPFLDSRPYAAAAQARNSHRLGIARRYGLDPDRPWLLAVAMMRPGDKLDSYKVLGESLALLIGHPWSLLVVGDGPARAEVQTALAPLGERVVFAGPLTDTELQPIYAAADLYVWPAVNEAFGMAILEAQAAGLPVVAGDFGGVSEIVAHGRTGALVRPRDTAALAAAIAPLLANPALRARWSQQALAKAAAEHDRAVAARALTHVLSQLPHAMVRA
ncbi:MAG: glycosyltransferase family 4 protein [Alphaproteobacteria bacterium]|nr:glycosyltransferase family 4 protein [Alphaproteobacteria bacterium]